MLQAATAVHCPGEQREDVARGQGISTKCMRRTYFVHTPVNGVVLPTAALLDPKISPLFFSQETRRGQDLRGLLGQHNVPVSAGKKVGLSRNIQRRYLDDGTMLATDT